MEDSVAAVFQYDDHARQSIGAISRLRDQSLADFIEALESGPTLWYAMATYGSTKTETGLRIRSDAKRIATATDAMLEAMRDSTFATPEGVDMRAYRAATLALNKRAHVDAAMPNWPIGATDRKAIRREFIVGLLFHWGLFVVNSGRLEDICRDMTSLLDFLEAASRPVLIAGDRFGHGESGRDALGKDVDKIRKHGVKQLPPYLLEALKELES